MVRFIELQRLLELFNDKYQNLLKCTLNMGLPITIRFPPRQSNDR